MTDSGQLNAGLLNILVGKLGPLPGSGALDSLKVQDWEKALRGIIGMEHIRIRKLALGGVGYNSVDFGECPCHILLLLPRVPLLPSQLYLTKLISARVALQLLDSESFIVSEEEMQTLLGGKQGQSSGDLILSSLVKANAVSVRPFSPNFPAKDIPIEVRFLAKSW